MALVKYTGKAMTASWASTPALASYGLRQIEIVETAAPLPAQIDTTTAVATAYEYTADPLGGKGAAHTTVTFTGLADSLDYATAGWSKAARNTPHALTVYPAGNVATNNLFTLTNAEVTSYRESVTVAGYTGYTVVLEETAVGAWSAAAGA